VLEDLGSKNGTFLRDERLTRPMPLLDGDPIRLGSLEFTFRMSTAAPSTETQLTKPPKRPKSSSPDR
jgi:pSer/pThr/pTyr-binding forkhead associated (FHA) protein